MSYVAVDDPEVASSNMNGGNGGNTHEVVLTHIKDGLDHVGKWLEVNDVKKVAGEMVMDNFEQYKGYIYDGPFSYRVANCIAGVSMIFFGTIGVFVEGGVINTLINFYEVGFGLLIVGLESTKPWMSKGMHDFLFEYFKFIFTMFGRGFFYIFAGILISVSEPWTNFIVGVFTCCTGVALLIYGMRAQSKLSDLKFGDDVAARQSFSRFDTDMDGKITISQFAAMCDSMGGELTMSHSELEAAVALIGDSSTRTISVDEFCKWNSERNAEAQKA